MKIKYKFSGDRLALIITLCVILFPVSIQSLRLFGAVITPSRIILPFMLLYILVKRRFYIQKTKISSFHKWIIFFICWICYSFLLLLLSKYVTIKEGVKEIEALIWGLAIIYVLYQLMIKNNNWKDGFKILRRILIFLVLMGLFEIFTGKHFINSFYYSEEGLYNMFYARGIPVNWHMATGFSYGVNDFASFLGIFSLVLFTENTNIRGRIINVLSFIGILFILYRNDSNIALFGILIAVFVYGIVILMKKRYWAFLFIISEVGMIAMLFMSNVKILERISLLGLANQLRNFSFGYGSLFARIMIYRDSIIAVFKNWLMGYGPASFSNYFIQNPSVSRLINPHSLFIEILLNYGAIVLLSFLFLLGELIIKNIKNYIKSKSKYAIIMVGMLSAYIILSFEPSNFLTYPYQWIIIAFSLVVEEKTRKICENE